MPARYRILLFSILLTLLGSGIAIAGQVICAGAFGSTTGPQGTNGTRTGYHLYDPVGSDTQKIWSVAQQFWNVQHDDRYPGTSCGENSQYNYDGGCACVATIQDIIYSATGRYVGNKTYNVDGFISAMNQGQGAQISMNQAVPGDIAILNGEGNAASGEADHIGVCANMGCSLVYSNSSSRATFSYPENAGGVISIYQVN